MKRKLSIFSILLLTVTFNIYCIGFGFHALEIRTSPEFSKGVFPTSLLYQFDFPVPDMIKGNTTQLSFRIDNGLDFRTLRQEPTTGIPYASNPNAEEWNYPRDYLTIYDEMNLVFGQGFLKTNFSDRDLFKLWGTFDIRFENAYERFDYLFNEENTEALFLKRTGSNVENRFDSWIGQPELTGKRSRNNISFSLGLDFNMMKEDRTRRNGIKNSFWVRLNPLWTNWMQDSNHDYMLFWDKLDISFTPYALKMNGSRDTTWFSIVLDNSTTYRYIFGNKVPYYVQGGNIFGVQALNTEHVLTNRTSLTLYGPQINSYDCYPYITGFVDVGISLGNLLNTNQTIQYKETIASVGFKAEFIIFDIASIFYEFGYVFDNVLNEKNTTVTRFGFSFGV